MNQQPVDKLVEFLRVEFGTQFKAYYNGDPDVIPDFNLPCVSVVKNSDQIGNGPTGLQRVTEELVVKIIYNKADDWTATTDEVDLTEKTIRDVVEGRDLETDNYLPQTVKQALLNRFTVSGLELNQAMTFELGVIPRSEDLVTQEGHLTLTVTYLVQNPQG